MKKILLISLMLFPYAYGSGQKQQMTKPAIPEPVDQKMDPEVKIIQPGVRDNDAPSDAIVLFNGADINPEWEDSKGNPPKWIVKDGALIVVKGSGIIKTKRKFSNFQLHIEWKTPSDASGDGQWRGNSGVYFQELYELQVLDSYNNRTYRNGQAGAMYQQHAPLVNVCRKPGEWQSYDIIFSAPVLSKDTNTYFTPPRVTVLQNGVLIQNNVSLRGPTDNGIPEYYINKHKHGPGSLVLQDHSIPVAYKNIWIREL